MKSSGIKKRKNGIETADRIITAAAELFANNGYDSVSMREIARKSGIRESSIYNHFRTKDEIKETLFGLFAELTEQSRPSGAEIDKMLSIMQPEEIFKSILFNVGKNINDTLRNTAMFIHYEKFRNPRAADIYKKYMIDAPVKYYERLIEKMIKRNAVAKVDARLFAEQYNYISTALTQEYFMEDKNVQGRERVVKYMITTLSFFCSLMKK